MKEVYVKRIEKMKEQTFGVEIEMTGITRGKAMRVIAKHFGTDETVEYFGTFYKRWICFDTKGRKWQAMTDSSISTTGGNDTSCEVVTPILTYDDMEDLQEIVRKLRKAGAISNPRHGCGVHIHIGANGHTAQTLRNLVNLMASHEELIANAIALPETRKQRWCRVVDKDFLKRLNDKKPETMAELADEWYKGHGDRAAHYNNSRYRMLNLHATFTKGTVEFRMFNFDNPSAERKGGLHAGQLKSWIQFCLMLSQYAKESNRASSKPVQMENQKWSMLTWIYRMGLHGDEFKTLRHVMMERLSGTRAHR